MESLISLLFDSFLNVDLIGEWRIKHFVMFQCVENVSRQNCPVCMEDIHTSRIGAHVLPCGHLLHKWVSVWWGIFHPYDGSTNKDWYFIISFLCLILTAVIEVWSWCLCLFSFFDTLFLFCRTCFEDMYRTG